MKSSRLYKNSNRSNTMINYRDSIFFYFTKF